MLENLCKFFMIVKLKAQQSYPFRPGKCSKCRRRGAEWWCGTVEGSGYMAQGFFPGNYVELLGAEVAGGQCGNNL
jgi:hypothetical protein